MAINQEILMGILWGWDKSCISHTSIKKTEHLNVCVCACVCTLVALIAQAATIKVCASRKHQEGEI